MNRCRLAHSNQSAAAACGLNSIADSRGSADGKTRKKLSGLKTTPELSTSNALNPLCRGVCCLWRRWANMRFWDLMPDCCSPVGNSTTGVPARLHSLGKVSSLSDEREESSFAIFRAVVLFKS